MYRRYHDRLYRMICLKKGSSEAEDLTQRVFVKALEHADRFREQASPFTWLYRIAMNTIIDEYRQAEQRRQKQWLSPSLITKDFTAHVELSIDLSKALQTFGELDKEIITLRFFVDCTLEEIASIVGMRKSAVKNRLYRALGRLRSEWHDAERSKTMSISELIHMVNVLENPEDSATNQAVTDGIMDELKANIDRITANYKPLGNTIRIEIYPDLPTFHQQTSDVERPDWYVAKLDDDGSRIRMVSPLNPGPRHSYQSVIQAVVSLFATAIAIRMNHDQVHTLPLWLKGGIGHYESRYYGDSYAGHLRSALQKGSIPALTTLDGDWQDFVERNGHLYACSVVEFIVETYGYDKLRALILRPDAYNDIFECSLAEFETQWKNYLTRKYR
ncbi:RNA polymerase sigma factor [Paenibacillus sp. 1P07SE]|uniref:RNA polymerase sigma factor n=1 Tax=Paenibacillus sp. 1P07SE TaxID=3132209 RepID=UPI0039A76045